MKDLNNLEVTLIKKYLISKNLDYEYFLNKFYPQFQFKDSNNLPKSHTLSIWEIIKIFETTIEEKFRKLNGAFYTPYFVVDYINTRVISENLNKEIKVIDPACGSGIFLIFLIDALFKLKQRLKKSYKDTIKSLFNERYNVYYFLNGKEVQMKGTSLDGPMT